MNIFLNNYRLIAITGPTAAHFLQGQFSCDMNTINSQRAGIGTYCNVKGRVIASFVIFSWKNVFYLLLPADMIADFTKMLQKYAVFSKITIQEASDLILIGLCDDVDHPLLKSIETPLGSVSNDKWCQIRLMGTPTRYLLVTEPNELEKMSIVIDPSLEKKATVRWNALEIQSGVASIHQVNSGKFLPHFLNCHQTGAISLNKGCYLGQEIIARMHYRGKLKYHMVLATLEKPIQLIPCDTLTTEEGKTLGEVVNTQTTQEKTFALVVVPKPSPNTVRLSVNGDVIQTELTPFHPMSTAQESP